MIAGEGPAPALVIALIQRLPEDSLTSALVAGDREFFGWNRTLSKLAELIDSVHMNTRATGQWKKGKVPDFPPSWRPGEKKSKKKNKSGSATTTDKSKPKASVASVFGLFSGKGK